MTLAGLRRQADAWAAQVLARDPFWSKCYPCRNQGLCCRGDSPLALPGEFRDIAAFVEGSADLRDKVADNMRAGRLCLLYDAGASACLAHDLRPLLCRLTPLKAYRKGNDVVVFDGAGNERCGGFLKRRLALEEIEGRFVRAEGNAYYLVNDFFDGADPTLDLRQAETLHSFFRG